MSEVMQRTGFLETLSPLKQDKELFSTRLLINGHVYLFKENTDRWDDSELDQLIAERVITRNTVLRNRGHFVCEVLNEDDYDSILSIGAGYRAYTPPKSSNARRAEPSTIPTTRESPVSATKPSSKKTGKGSSTTPRPGKAPDTPAPAYTGPDPAAG
jgi:hypothetical protein